MKILTEVIPLKGKTKHDRFCQFPTTQEKFEKVSIHFRPGYGNPKTRTNSLG